MKPIIFNTEMVRAILDGRKTQTRRVVKPQPERTESCAATEYTWIYKHASYALNRDDDVKRECAKATLNKVGDILWVRETWAEYFYVDENRFTHYDKPKFYYKTDGDYQIDIFDDDGHYLDNQRMKWCPSIHMPKEAARIFLKVTDVRVERLQDISGIDVLQEGVNPNWYNGEPERWEISQRNAYRKLWDSLNAKRGYGWDTNPWVWVYEFERVEVCDK